MPYEKKLTERQVEALVSLAEALGLEAGDFDDEVHDFKSHEASDINNGGLEAQLEYLCDGMDFDEACVYVKKIRGELIETDAEAEET